MFKTWMRLIMTALVLTAGVSQAQMSRSFFPWWEMGFTRDLNLSEQQQQQIREILRENRSKMIDMRAALEKVEGEVEDLFEESNADQRRATEVVERMVSARDNMTRHFTLMSLQMRRVLTNEQWKDLQSRRGRFENMRRGPAAATPGAPRHGPEGAGAPRRQGERKSGNPPQNQQQ